MAGASGVRRGADGRGCDVLAQRIGEDARARLAAARVGVAGLGGLGSNVAIQLARSGVGELHLVDFDFVDESNLNRQHYFRRHLGRTKVDALAEQILDIDADIVLSLDRMRVDSDNAAALFACDPIVCEAFDVAECKADLANALLLASSDTVVVSGSGMAGAGPAADVLTRRVGTRLYVCGDCSSDVEREALFAPRVTLCASQQALVVVRLILGLEEA